MKSLNWIVIVMVAILAGVGCAQQQPYVIHLPSQPIVHREANTELRDALRREWCEQGKKLNPPCSKTEMLAIRNLREEQDAAADEAHRINQAAIAAKLAREREHLESVRAHVGMQEEHQVLMEEGSFDARRSMREKERAIEEQWSDIEHEHEMLDDERARVRDEAAKFYGYVMSVTGGTGQVFDCHENACDVIDCTDPDGDMIPECEQYETPIVPHGGEDAAPSEE